MATDSLRELKAGEFDYWKAHHLLNRAGFGGTPSQVRALTNLGLEGAVDHLLNFESIPGQPVRAEEFDRNIMRPATMEERGELRRARQRGDEAAVERLRRERIAAEQADRVQTAAMQKWWLKRMIETPRPFEEKMALFFHGHFATNYRAVEDSYHMFLQNQLFRASATGNFKALVHKMIRDPAMIVFLNNHQNRAQAPNENLARELMELFTLGEGNDYTEDDIKEGARALTGYTYNDDEFYFDERVHDKGTKRILGQSGNFDGDDFVNLIFTRPKVSQFLCLKLYRYFVSDMPGLPESDGQKYVLKLADEFRRHKYELKPVLRTMFLSQHFYSAENMASQIKSPLQLVVQAIRSLRVPARRLSALVSAGDLMGQSLFFPPTVKGWDGGRAWINTATLFVRQNVMVYLLTGRRPDAYEWETDGSEPDLVHLVDHLRSDSGAVSAHDAVTYLLRFTLGAEPSEDRVAPLVTFVERHGGKMDTTMLIALLSLITAMPEYQLC
jgi:uncharacterized protein (DUF1800 family)